MPRIIQAEVHRDQQTIPSEAAINAYRDDIIALYNSIAKKDDFDNHLLREFNRRVVYWGRPDLAFTPYDSGFR